MQCLSLIHIYLIREYRVAIKGPLTTPVGGGIRSLNVALRQELDLYICLRPVRYYPVSYTHLSGQPDQRTVNRSVRAGVAGR